ncbi:C25 family cysteine peptidase [Flavobacterium chungnamense]|uniref:Gingipain domain-containing protein n=1 Tax=Flavobacterium chungnamense TaxID=706182 RepID=A0ABP7UUQ5_9FLAO
MKFCHNCGENLASHRGSKFCSNCGTALILSESNRITDSNKPPQPSKVNYDSYGIIFTNTVAIADNFGIEQAEVINILADYIEKLISVSHQYIILDASNNSYVNLNPDDTWENHVKLLRDYYNDLESKPEYLFIIGGHNIIPMAIINNQAGCYEDDSDIDTDMPYSYLKIENFESLLWNGNIFKESLLLNVGRIPFATDSDIYDLKNYLDRSSDSVLTNVQINNCFGMTALSWKSASEKIIQNANAQKILHTSPQIDINSVDNVYDESAELYYYNLHGSDAPSASQFYGDNGGAVAPKHIAKAVNPNFFITEACYGAKFIDYDKQSAMLHSALNNNTLAFVGSSRVAFGACSSNISSADIVAKSFIDALFDSVNCGKALSKARIDVFDACPDEQYNYGVTSAVEFNLFGDPILKASDSSKSMFRKSSGNTLKNNSIKSKSYTKSKPEIKEIDFQNLEKGILNDVRNLVNNEVLKIREIVDTYLYQNFNVDKRCIQKVFLIKSKFGEETFNYTYQNQNGNIQTTYSVFTDKRGKIKSILTSK